MMIKEKMEALEKEWMKQEALRRMELIGLSSDIINSFEEENKVRYCHLPNLPCDSGELVQIIKQIELTYDVLIYHAIFEIDEEGEKFTFC